MWVFVVYTYVCVRWCLEMKVSEFWQKELLESGSKERLSQVQTQFSSLGIDGNLSCWWLPTRAAHPKCPLYSLHTHEGCRCCSESGSGISGAAWKLRLEGWVASHMASALMAAPGMLSALSLLYPTTAEEQAVRSKPVQSFSFSLLYSMAGKLFFSHYLSLFLKKKKKKKLNCYESCTKYLKITSKLLNF